MPPDPPRFGMLCMSCMPDCIYTLLTITMLTVTKLCSPPFQNPGSAPDPLKARNLPTRSVAKDSSVTEILYNLQKWRHFDLFEDCNGYYKLSVPTIALFYTLKESLFCKELKRSFESTVYELANQSYGVFCTIMQIAVNKTSVYAIKKTAHKIL